MFNFKAKIIFKSIIITVITAMIISLFAFVFHSKLHKDHFHNQVQNVCTDAIIGDISSHIHRSDDLEQHEDNNCSICNLSYLNLTINSNNTNYLFVLSPCDSLSKNISFHFSERIFTGYFLRSPPSTLHIV